MQRGSSDPVVAIHRRADAAVRRRWVYLALGCVVLLALLLLVPEQQVTNTATNASSVTLLPGMTPPTPQYGSGITVGGVACGPGVRQVPWSSYAPPCQPAWHGNNGGATTRGVTGTTIKLTYRAASTAQLAELYGLVPPSVVGTNASVIQTLQSYINAFNKSYELYGRKVVLVPFDGKGDFIDETLGMGQAQAQEDAVTVAQSIKAFADMSLVDASNLYASDLASQHVVVSSLYENDASWFEQYAPWEYTPGPNCSKMAQATGAILGKQLGGLPASFAGSPQLRDKTRVFGLISPLNPLGAACAAADQSAMAAHGQQIAKSVTVKFDLTSLVATSDAAVAEMKAAGVTTVILSSADPITPRFFMEAADADDYYPEWWFQSDFPGGQTNNDGFTALFPADQTRDIIGIGTQTQPLDSQEADTAYNIGNTEPGAKPFPAFLWAYQTVVQFFDALQLAGPDLTPANFEAAMKRIPQSEPGGLMMTWNGSTGPFDPASQYGVVKFDPTLKSPLNGRPGTYIACDQGKLVSYGADGADVPAHQQLVCAPLPAKAARS